MKKLLVVLMMVLSLMACSENTEVVKDPNTNSAYTLIHLGLSDFDWVACFNGMAMFSYYSTGNQGFSPQYLMKPTDRVHTGGAEYVTCEELKNGDY